MQVSNCFNRCFFSSLWIFSFPWELCFHCHSISKNWIGFRCSEFFFVHLFYCHIFFMTVSIYELLLLIHIAFVQFMNIYHFFRSFFSLRSSSQSIVYLSIYISLIKINLQIKYFQEMRGLDLLLLSRYLILLRGFSHVLFHFRHLDRLHLTVFFRVFGVFIYKTLHF